MLGDHRDVKSEFKEGNCTKRGQDICVQSRMAYSRVFVVDSNGGHGTILCALKVCKDVFVQCGTTLYYSSRCKYDISPC
jgi:hypothetical protein